MGKKIRLVDFGKCILMYFLIFKLTILDNDGSYLEVVVGFLVLILYFLSKVRDEEEE